MKLIYVLTIFLVVLFGVGGLYFNSPVATGRVVDNVNRITGFAGSELILPGNLIGGNVSNCFVYNDECPTGSTQVFRVGYEFFDNAGGSHIAAHDNDVFSWRMCCFGILGPGGDRNFTFLNTGQDLIGWEGNMAWGSHAMVGNTTTPKDKDVPVANYIVYDNQGCPEHFVCLAKISPHDFNATNQYNGHVWSCNTTFTDTNMVSVCYKPEEQTSCQMSGPDYRAGLCTIPGWFFDPIREEWLYCSFGEDDEQIPPYPEQGYEKGACCREGEYSKIFSLEPLIFTCEEYSECGFYDDYPCDFDWEDTENPPPQLYQQEYFDQPGCVTWEEDTSCCFQVYMFGGFGNYPCPIETIQN